MNQIKKELSVNYFNKSLSLINEDIIPNQCVEFFYKYDLFNKFEKKELQQIIPILIGASEFNEVKRFFLESTKKMKKLYFVKFLAYSIPITYKNKNYFVSSLGLFYEWQDFLIRNTGIYITTDIFKTNKNLEKIINENISFKKTELRKSYYDLFKIIDKEDNTYIFKSKTLTI